MGNSNVILQQGVTLYTTHNGAFTVSTAPTYSIQGDFTIGRNGESTAMHYGGIWSLDADSVVTQATGYTAYASASNFLGSLTGGAGFTLTAISTNASPGGLGASLGDAFVGTVKIGDGTTVGALALSGTSASTGNIILTSTGDLGIGSGGVLGNTTIIVQGGSIHQTTTSGMTINTTPHFIVEGDFSLTGGTGLNYGTADWTLKQDVTITNTIGNTINNVGDSGMGYGLTVIGAANLTLGGTGSIGNLTVGDGTNAGTVTLGSTAAVDRTVAINVASTGTLGLGRGVAPITFAGLNDLAALAARSKALTTTTGYSLPEPETTPFPAASLAVALSKWASPAQARRPFLASAPTQASPGPSAARLTSTSPAPRL